jgi:hypothetical protein
MARAIIGMPLSLNCDSSFSGPRTASPTSFTLISLPFTFFIIILLNSSSVFNFPKVLTESSVALPEILPDGNSTFYLSKAF